MNQTIETILNHVSVRSFTDQALSEEQIRQLVTAAQAASTSSFQQAYSIIGLHNQELKEKLAELAGNQSFIAEGGHFFVFCADKNRHKQMAEELNMDISESIEGIDAALVGAIDATVAAQNMVIAAESMGLGVCYIGGVRNEIIKISELLDIPEYVYPLYGLVVGYPIERNDIKPRIPFEGIYYRDRYNSNTKEILKQYNDSTEVFFANRAGSHRTWAETAIEGIARYPRMYMKDFLNGKGWAKH